MKRNKMLILFDKYDQILAYFFLIAFAVWELLSIINSKLLDSLNLDSNGAFILLALGILTLIRSINEGLSRTKTNVKSVKITDGLLEMLTSKSSHTKIDAFMKDGIGFYITYSECDRHIKNMRLILTDDRIIDGWIKLYQRGLVDNLVIKKHPNTSPLLHLTIIPDNYVLFGEYGIYDGVPRCLSSVLIENTGKDTKDFMAIYLSIYNRLWEESDVVFNSGMVSDMEAIPNLRKLTKE